jgi:DNA mismatch endonuclease (patch repair protein)
MAAVKRKDTKPEVLVRSVAHRLGLRFRLHVKTLPGTPDIVFPRWRTVLFVHGCFWHGHSCRFGRVPKTRAEFWSAKQARNRERDAATRTALEALGWRVVEMWTCEIQDIEALDQRLRQLFCRI